MSEVKIIGAAVPNMPWQERQEQGKAGMPVCINVKQGIWQFINILINAKKRKK